VYYIVWAGLLRWSSLWCWAVSVTHITHGLWPPPWLAPCDLL
jgi:hypothetical protein